MLWLNQKSKTLPHRGLAGLAVKIRASGKHILKAAEYDNEKRFAENQTVTRQEFTSGFFVLWISPFSIHHILTTLGILKNFNAEKKGGEKYDDLQHTRN